MTKDRKMVLHQPQRGTPYITVYDLESSSISYQDGNRSKVSLRLGIDDTKRLIQGLNECLSKYQKNQEPEIRWCHLG